MKNNIKLAREAKCLTQKECADYFNVTLRAWQTYEQGISEPKNELLCKIADMFNVSTDYLLGRSEKQNDPFAVYDLTNDERSFFNNFLEQDHFKRQAIIQTLKVICDKITIKVTDDDGKEAEAVIYMFDKD